MVSQRYVTLDEFKIIIAGGSIKLNEYQYVSMIPIDYCDFYICLPFTHNRDVYKESPVFVFKDETCEDILFDLIDGSIGDKEPLPHHYKNTSDNHYKCDAHDFLGYTYVVITKDPKQIPV